MTDACMEALILERDKLRAICKEQTEALYKAIAHIRRLSVENRNLRKALEFIRLPVWLSKYSGDVEWLKINIQAAAKAALGEE